MNAEVWKPIPGFEGRYEVSDAGRVRNAHGRILSANRQTSGYYIVHLYSGSRASRQIRLLHRLVAEAFLPEGSGEVNHIDGDKANNALSNLEWATRSENMQHAVRTGLHSCTRFAVLGVHTTTGERLRFSSQQAAEVHFRGKATSAIYRCVEGHRRSAYGYVWSRA